MLKKIDIPKKSRKYQKEVRNIFADRLPPEIDMTFNASTAGKILELVSRRIHKMIVPLKIETARLLKSPSKSLFNKVLFRTTFVMKMVIRLNTTDKITS